MLSVLTFSKLDTVGESPLHSLFGILDLFVQHVIYMKRLTLQDDSLLRGIHSSDFKLVHWF